ncbi:methionyl-tRNA formyltransferase [Candidatus Azoamicus ciliaticola]|uniref:Methionyl-tRNA formyltransferase n=1 Tax=Candidatus Azoamicus ciliaticola TaxID=2652803 RepID=A0A6J5JW51_9GAMM|nr:methionyl-tRNA formyltransferase [Candidatus Azoamicus ciliaticola]CAB3976244.1 Methionyl-tRNA formyltransferase [Candidatus Azoamicus ciliaticola]
MNNLIFIGTNNFAAEILEKLIKKNIKIICTITKPDNEFGRGHKITKYPVKITSEKYSIPCITEEKINSLESENKIKHLFPNLIIMVDYGEKIKKNIINIAKYGIINIHPSILPKLKGPTPIQTAILNGEKETGVSIIKINNKIDSGNILNIMTYKIKKNDNYEKLFKNLSRLAVTCLIKTIKDIENKKIIEKIQKIKKSTYTQKIENDFYKINWNDTAINIERKVKALTGIKYPFTIFKNEKIKIVYVKLIKRNIISTPGVIKNVNKNGIDITTKENIIRIKKLQFQGKKIITVKDMLNSKKNLFKINEFFE